MGAVVFLIAMVVLAFLAFAINKGKVSEKAIELTMKGLVVLGALGLLLFAAGMILRFWAGFLIIAVIAGALAVGQLLFKGKDTWRGNRKP